jgi:hypothetical protein
MAFNITKEDVMMNMTIGDLMSLKSKVESGKINRTDLELLLDSNPGNRLSEKLREYLITGDSQYLEFSPEEAFKAVFYRTTVQEGVPVMYGGDFIPSPSVKDPDPEIPIITSRPSLVPGLLVGYWQDDPLERVELSSGRQTDLVRHAPYDLEWEGQDYLLVAETLKKSFYFPKDNIPEYIKPWLSLEPQKRSDLAAGLKRQGVRLQSLAGLPLSLELVHKKESTEPKGVYGELGVCILSAAQFLQVQEEIGIPVHALQATLWFANGSYFKGTLESESLSGLAPGFYGGLKHPAPLTEPTTSVLGAVMDEYSLVPWRPSMNRQQTDYADIPLPVRSQFPEPDTFIKAATGFPGYVRQFNQKLLASAYRLFQKAPVKGFAGKVGVTTESDHVHFVIRGQSIHREEIKDMAFLFSPALPVHTEVMHVRVKLIPDDKIHNHLILLNVHPTNLQWVSRWYMQWAGRDCDGDGFTLSDDNCILQYTKTPEKISWFDTTKFKSVSDEPEDTEFDAVRTATGRIRSASHLIGMYDKAARRIIRQAPELMTYDLSSLFTEAIQRAISSQKKNSGSERFRGYQWILEHLPEGSESWLIPGEDALSDHDRIDALEPAFKSLGKSGLPVPEMMAEAHNVLKTVQNIMPDHAREARNILELLMEPDQETLDRLRNRGRNRFESVQSRTSRDTVVRILGEVDECKLLWQSVAAGTAKYNLTYGEASRIIAKRMGGVLKTDYTITLVSLLKEFPMTLLANILSIEELQMLRIISGCIIPIWYTGRLSVNNLFSGDDLQSMASHPSFRQCVCPESAYRITAVKETGANYQTITHIIKIKEVQK